MKSPLMNVRAWHEWLLADVKCDSQPTMLDGVPPPFGPPAWIRHMPNLMRYECPGCIAVALMGVSDFSDDIAAKACDEAAAAAMPFFNSPMPDAALRAQGAHDQCVLLAAKIRRRNDPARKHEDFEKRTEFLSKTSHHKYHMGGTYCGEEVTAETMLADGTSPSGDAWSRVTCSKCWADRRRVEKFERDGGGAPRFA